MESSEFAPDFIAPIKLPLIADNDHVTNLLEISRYFFTNFSPVFYKIEIGNFKNFNPSYLEFFAK